MSTDMRKFFDPANMDEQTLGFIEFVLNSPAYEEAFKPYLEGRRDQMELLARDRSQRRKDEYPDDFLYGGINAIEGLLKLFSLLITQTDVERVQDAMAGMDSEKQYEMRRQQGRVSPVVGVDQPAMPQVAPGYDPREDF